MEQIKKNIAALSDEELLHQYTNFKDEFTNEALLFFEEEIKRRDLTVEGRKKTEFENRRIETVELEDKDFTQLDHYFNKIELELAITVLRDKKIICYIDNPSSSDTIPLESEADKLYSIHVYNKSIDEVHALLDEHFEKIEGKYLLKNRTVGDQLKVISFSQLPMSEQEAAEIVEVEFSVEEKTFITEQGTYILKNADTIEQEQERVLFYYDMLEPLTAHLSDGSLGKYTKSELLTVLEIIQISAQMGNFPRFMEDATSALIDMFIN